MNVYLLPGLAAGPVVIRHLIQRVPMELLDVPTHPDRFTPREVIAHLADWETILREDRVKAAVTKPGSDILAFDEGERAIQLRYSTWDINESISRFSAEREKTIELLRQLSQEQLLQTVTHPERGIQSAYDILNMMLGHDAYHAEQLCAVLSIN